MMYQLIRPFIFMVLLTGLLAPVGIMSIATSQAQQVEAQQVEAQEAETQATATEAPAEIAIDSASATADWQFDASLVIWAPSVKGDVGVGPVAMAVDAGFLDIVDASDTVLGWDGRVEAWHKNRFGLAFESIGILVDASLTTQGFPTIAATADIELLVLDFELGYRLLQKEIGDHSVLTVDALGGFRYTHFQNALGAAASGPLGFATGLGGSADWLEPIIGGRVHYGLYDRWGFSVRGNVGGFNVGPAESSWRLITMIEYGIHDQVNIFAGYQVYGLDMSEGNGIGAVQFDGELHGPILGATFNF